MYPEVAEVHRTWEQGAHQGGTGKGVPYNSGKSTWGKKGEKRGTKWNAEWKRHRARWNNILAASASIVLGGYTRRLGAPEWRQRMWKVFQPCQQRGGRSGAREPGIGQFGERSQERERISGEFGYRGCRQTRFTQNPQPHRQDPLAQQASLAHSVDGLTSLSLCVRPSLGVGGAATRAHPAWRGICVATAGESGVALSVNSEGLARGSHWIQRAGQAMGSAFSGEKPNARCAPGTLGEVVTLDVHVPHRTYAGGSHPSDAGGSEVCSAAGRSSAPCIARGEAPNHVHPRS